MGCTFVFGFLVQDILNHYRVAGTAGVNESGKKKSSEAPNNLQTFRAKSLQSNMKVIYFQQLKKPRQGFLNVQCFHFPGQLSIFVNKFLKIQKN